MARLYTGRETTRFGHIIALVWCGRLWIRAVECCLAAQGMDALDICFDQRAVLPLLENQRSIRCLSIVWSEISYFSLAQINHHCVLYTS